MISDKDHFEFFRNLIYLKGGATVEVNFYYIDSLPEEDKTGLTLNTDGFPIRDTAFSFFVRKAQKSEKYRDYFRSYIEKEKIGLRKDISTSLMNKQLNERIEILQSKLYDICHLIGDCRDSQLWYAGLVASALIDISNNFLLAYKKNFDSEFYEYIYNSINQNNTLQNSESTGIHTSKDQVIGVSKPQLPQKGINNLRFNLVKPVSTCIAALNDLHTKLKGKIECDQRDFKAVFGYGVMNEIPLWTGDIQELRYLINILIEKGFIKRPKDGLKWKTVLSCFRLPDKELTTFMLRHTKVPTDPDSIDTATAHIRR